MSQFGQGPGTPYLDHTGRPRDLTAMQPVQDPAKSLRFNFLFTNHRILRYVVGAVECVFK